MTDSSDNSGFVLTGRHIALVWSADRPDILELVIGDAAKTAEREYPELLAAVQMRAADRAWRDKMRLWFRNAIKRRSD